MVLLRKKPNAATDAYMPDMIFRYPLDTRPLSVKRADNKQVAKGLHFCMGLVMMECAIDTQSGFIHGRQLAQNIVDLDSQATMNAYDFYGGRQYLKICILARLAWWDVCLFYLYPILLQRSHVWLMLGDSVFWKPLAYGRSSDWYQESLQTQ